MNCQKDLFNLTPTIHYLNCAYKSPLLRGSEEACVKALIRGRNPVDISIDDFFLEVNEVRKGFGQIVNCNPSNVAIIPSTSYGFSSVLNNVKGKKNGHAITIKEEFPSVYFSLKRWCENNQNELIVVNPNNGVNLLGESWNQNILSAIDENTSIVVISSVHWMTGLKYDLKSIGEKCALVGAKFIVDGTQSVGALPMDVLDFKIDALICASYKWLFGPYSIGLAYISDEFENGIPLEESWMNRTNAKDFAGLTKYDSTYRSNAGKYNVGETSNFILMPLLNASIKQLNLWGISNIQNYAKKLIEPLKDYLQTLNIALETEKYFSNHLFALKLPHTIKEEKLKENLTKNKVFISVRGQYLRVSVNVFNDEDDIDMLIQSIEMTIRDKGSIE